MVPAHRVPARSPPGTSSQICSRAGPSPSLALGNVGAAISVQRADPASARCSLTPKWPRLRAVYWSPLRGSAIAMDTGSPRKQGSPQRHSPWDFSKINSPLRVPTRSLVVISLISLKSTAGKRLHHIHPGRRGQRIAQPRPVPDQRPIHKNRHVLAQPILVIEDVAAEAGILRKHLPQRLHHRPGRHIPGRAVHMALEVVGEGDDGHCLSSTGSTPITVADVCDSSPAAVDGHLPPYEAPTSGKALDAAMASKKACTR